MNKTTWKCEICGYISQGDNPPDTCPTCGAGREAFKPFEVAGAEKTKSVFSAWKCSVCGHIHEGQSPPEICSVCKVKADLFEAFKDEAASASSHSAKNIVIIGGGIAGLTAAQQARITSPRVRIILVSKESIPPYYRINLTRYLAGEVAEKDLPIKPQSWFEENKIELIQGDVASIKKDKRRITLKDNQTLDYDRLILANGSHSFVPPIPGVDLGGVKVLRTLRDAEDILKKSANGRRCVCVGGGLLGLEAAGALRKRNLQTTILEGSDWPLRRQLPQKAGLMLKNHLESLGLSIICGARIEEITGDKNVRAVRLADGEEIPADLVILSTGVRPNSDLAKRSQIKTQTGVVVDDRLFTSDPSILAAGDVAEHRGRLYGIWPAAYSQGAVAGVNAADGEAEFGGLAPSTRLKVMDVNIFSVGQISDDDGLRLFEQEGENSYVGIICRNNQIAGAALFGDVGMANQLKKAVESRTQISDLKSLLDKIPKLADFIRA